MAWPPHRGWPHSGETNATVNTYYQQTVRPNHVSRGLRVAGTSPHENGDLVEAVEDAELVGESMDWERHLLMGFISEKVAKVVSDFFAEASKKRYEHIAERIDETFKDNEVAVLFIREGHRVQFPADIEVFSVFPPVLNDIHRWMRDYAPEDKTGEAKE